MSLATAAPQILRLLAPHAKTYRGRFLAGALCALIVVGLRLALPWPLRGIYDTFVNRDLPASGYGWLPSGLDPVLALAGAFLVLVSALGVFDLLERFYFARFAIGTVRSFRAEAFRKLRKARSKKVSMRKGDLVSRLIGDTARVKTGIQGFFVHVATNGLLFLGIVAVLMTMDVYLGLALAVGAAVTLVVTALGAAQMFGAALKHRKKEGQLADQIAKKMRKGSHKSRFKKLNKSSGRHEASQTWTQGMVTSTVHGIYGITTVVAIWLGTRLVADGQLELGDIVVLLMYVMMLRTPMVILARQGSRTGKILGAAHRIAQVVELKSATPATADDRSGSVTRGAAGDARDLHGTAFTRPDLPGAARQPSPFRSAGSNLQVLFTGYAPVHFLCFRPLYERLLQASGVEVFFSGGLRTKTESGWLYDEQRLYEPLDVPADRVLSVSQIQERDFDVLFAGNTKMIAPRHVSKRIQIFHGISFRNKAIRPANLNCDYYFIIGPYMRRRFVGAGHFAPDDARILPIGFMKTDRLFDPHWSRETALSRHGFGGDRPIILYAPTGAEKNSLEIMGEEVIERIVQCNQFDLIVKPHDHPILKTVNWFERLSRFEGAHCRVTPELDVITLLRLADLLITDASSVANEYALLDRPMVFLDTPELIARAGAAKHSKLDLQTWGRQCGLVAQGPDDVIGIIEKSLAHPGERSHLRQAMVNDLFYNPGKATDAAMAWVERTLLDSAPC